jgi:hypothetical protein
MISSCKHDYALSIDTIEKGVKLTVKSKDWYDKNRDLGGNVQCGSDTFIDRMSEFCGTVVTVEYVEDLEADHTGKILKKIRIAEDGGSWWWTPEMFECMTI